MSSAGAANGGTIPIGEAGETSQSYSGEQRAQRTSSEKLQTGEAYLDVLGTDMVVIHVGGQSKSSRKHFRVHKKILCSKIPFFDKMFNGRFKEAKEQVAYLTEDTPSSFDLLIEWVYTGKLRPFQILIVDGVLMKERCIVLDFFMLVNKLCLFPLRDTVLDTYIESLKVKHQFQTCRGLFELWTKSGEGSVPQRFVILATCWILHGMKRTEVKLQGWPVEGFLILFMEPKFQAQYLDLVINGPSGKKFEDLRSMPRCTFHHHGEHQPCTAKSSLE